MGKVYPIELRERAVVLVESGLTHRAAAERLQTSVKFINDMVKLKRETGALVPLKQGRPTGRQLAPATQWVRERIVAKPEITLNELVAEIGTELGVITSRVSVWRLLHSLDLSFKKNSTSQ